MVHAGRAVWFPRAGAHIPGENVKAQNTQCRSHAKDIFTAAVALQPVGQNNYPPAHAKALAGFVRSWMQINIQKVAIWSIDALPCQTGRQCELWPKK